MKWNQVIVYLLFSRQLAVPGVTYVILIDVKGYYLNFDTFYLFIHYFISFDIVIYMTQQMGWLLTTCCPFLALLWVYALGVIGFQFVLLLLQQNK